MDNPSENYWKIRLNDCREALIDNNFEADVVESVQAAKKLFMDEILPAMASKSVSWGGSMTLGATEILKDLARVPDLELINPSEKGLSDQDKYERRRQGLLADLFLTGTNAVTETGELVNLDMIGNRVGGLTFGPRRVVVLAGRNKIVPDVEEAMLRIKNYAAPVNAMRLDKKTPCVKGSRCQNCSSAERICNIWTIIEKSFPKGRIRVVLINQDLGL